MTSQTPASNPQGHSGILKKTSRIFLAGHQGMVGSAIYRKMQAEDYLHVITRSHKELDLVNQAAVWRFFENEKIDLVILAAAKVGGIQANNLYQAEFIFENLMIQNNVIHGAYRSGVKRLLFLGSSCIYPKHAEQPMREEQLLTGTLESSNEPYAIAKIAGIKLCESYNRQYGTHYRSIMPTNLYGPNDNFDLQTSHVLPAMIRKFHLAKLARVKAWDSIQKDEDLFGPLADDFKQELEAISRTRGSDSKRSSTLGLWGSGQPMREFLHVDDMASASLFLCNLEDSLYEAVCKTSLEKPDLPKQTIHAVSLPSDRKDRDRVPHINVGSGKDLRIAELAEIVQDVVGYDGAVSWNTSMPDGTPRKLLDISRLTQLGWRPRINLLEGIESTYQWYLDQSELNTH